MLFKSNTVYTLYSNFNAQWWYGVPKSEWEDWQNQHLAFLMKESNEVYSVLLNPNEAVTLLSRCGQDHSKGDKKITIRRPTSGGEIYFVEWNEFPLSSRLCSLQVPWV